MADEKSTGAPNPAGETESVTIRNVPVSIIQAMYNEITGKTENISKFIDKTKITSRNDIIDLCHKFTQSCEQYHTKGLNISFTIRHSNNTVVNISSPKKFSEYNANDNSRIESVEIEIRVLIFQPTAQKHLDYKIEIGIGSAGFEREEFPNPRLFRMLYPPSMYIRIDYVDYAVARNFVNIFEEWADGLDDVEKSSVLEWFKKNYDMSQRGQLVRLFSNITVGLLSLYSTYRLYGYLSHSIDGIVYLALLGCAIYITSTRFATFSVNLFLGELRGYNAPSLIRINRADERNYEGYIKAKKSILAKFLIGVFQLTAVILLNIVSNIIFIAIFS